MANAISDSANDVIKRMTSFQEIGADVVQV